MVTGQPVIGEVIRVLPWTIELTFVSLILGILIGVPAGVYAAIHRNRFADYAMRISSLLGLSFPPFVAAILLLLAFAIAVPWFPVISARSGSLAAWYQSITLPAVSLGLITAAYVTRVTRSAMLEVLSEDYVRTARAKGVPWNVVVWRHALRNALHPDHHGRRTLSRHPDRQLGADRDRVQPAGLGQAADRRAQSARLSDAAGDDGDLHARRRASQHADRPRVRIRRPAREAQVRMT
jgi:ABC-type methionine transport system permease subunit